MAEGPHSGCWFGEPCAVGQPETCPPTIAQRAREHGDRWGELVVQREAGGLRHYLEGEPVHCGEGLTLQATETPLDEYGSWLRYLPRGTRVRYEAQFLATAIRATLHADVSGHEFVAALEPWMRFRWPDAKAKGR